MEKSLFKVIVVNILLYTTLFSVCQAQPCLPGIEKETRPLMWFPKQEGIDRMNLFRISKKPVLNSNSGVIQKGTVELGNFLGLLRYFESLSNYKKLRIYIGMYSDEGSAGVPPGYGKQLTLIFSPANDAGQDLNPNTYYVIPPGQRFDPGNIPAFQINNGAKELLVKNYFDRMPLTTIDRANPSNNCRSCSYQGPTDTRSILYDASPFKELVKEQEFCHRDLTNTFDITITTDILAFFTAENINGGNVDNYRITLAFHFTTAGFLPIELEDTYGFDVRRKMKPLDNGQLCPTVCQ